MTINIKQLNLSVLLILIMLVVPLIPNMTLLSYLALIQLILGVVLLYFNNGKIISLMTLFLMLSFAFHMGNVVLTQLNGYEPADVLYNDINLLLNSVKFVIECHGFLLFGFLIKNKNKTAHLIRKQIVPNDLLNNQKIMWIGIILTLVGIIPKLKIVMSQYRARALGDYLDTYNVNLGGIGGLASLYYLGVELLLFACSGNKRLSRFIMLLCIMLEIVAMLSGNRYNSMAFMCVLVYIYLTKVDKVSIKNGIVYFVVTFIGCAFLVTTRETRMEKFSIELLIKILINSLKENPLFNMLYEMGGSIKTVLWCIKYVPNDTSYAKGMTFVETIMSAFPKFFVKLGYEFKYYGFSGYVPSLPNHGGMGGSWIGELYYNFSYYGVLVAYLIGKIVSNFDNVLSEAFQRNDYKKIVYIMPFLFYMFASIRDCSLQFRVAIIQFIVSVMVLFVVHRITIKSNNLMGEQ